MLITVELNTFKKHGATDATLEPDSTVRVQRVGSKLVRIGPDLLVDWSELCRAVAALGNQ